MEPEAIEEVQNDMVNVEEMEVEKVEQPQAVQEKKTQRVKSTQKSIVMAPKSSTRTRSYLG